MATPYSTSSVRPIRSAVDSRQLDSLIDVFHRRHLSLGVAPGARIDVGDVWRGSLNVILSFTNTIYRDGRRMTPPLGLALRQGPYAKEISCKWDEVEQSLTVVLIAFRMSVLDSWFSLVYELASWHHAVFIGTTFRLERSRGGEAPLPSDAPSTRRPHLTPRVPVPKMVLSLHSRNDACQ
ncbi:hypothetical protein THAOC_19893 [Thalassiosira oceanica]|uniref:Uncharacterized protein n=1 Tax=Thalassiosira oceanica TaxID=159749 RepID=K0SFX0_THAOC|nr:hypothetical protein THAOC_19893 [Thalassiosira oceanica]|eukprot:EJK59836.1 hypothetical protein THAOC_19893 [Thalassiosira oceanica]